MDFFQVFLSQAFPWWKVIAFARTFSWAGVSCIHIFPMWNVVQWFGRPFGEEIPTALWISVYITKNCLPVQWFLWKGSSFTQMPLSDSITHSPMLTFNRTVRKTCLPFTHLWLRGCRFQEVCKGMLQDSWALARQSLTGDSFSTWDRAQDSWSCQVSPFCSFLTPAWARNTQLLSWLGNEEFWHN